MFNPYFFFSQTPNQIASGINCQISLPQINLQNNEQFLCQNVFAAINSHQQILREIDAIKKELKVLKQENSQYAQKIEKLQKQRKEYDLNNRKGKKIFKKNIYCPYSGCQNKYSSKIALNSHIRAKHKRRNVAEIDQLTPNCQLN